MPFSPEPLNPAVFYTPDQSVSGLAFEGMLKYKLLLPNCITGAVIHNNIKLLPPPHGPCAQT